ncbi:hypothetical protein [Alkalihalobacterium elongatum]|uniref:hypothetical protein n=1 Tax=Alkalihalobacterium elongatum TaxID=2675466 RepID=UPI001C1FD75E|nr:hypothetical protein [Alkalihalobacterium elongatum]
MKATFRLPKTPKGWLFLFLIVLNVVLGCWPVILLFNTETIVFGIPFLMFWTYLIVFSTTLTMWLSTKMGVY